MTALERASERVLAATQQDDFEELHLALEERESLLASGASVTEKALTLGEDAAVLLLGLKQKLAAESSRLQQVRTGLLDTISPTLPLNVDYQG